METNGAKSETCDPYVSGDGNVPLCPTTGFCSDGTTAPVLYKCKSGSVVHPTTVATIKAEIYNNGPVEASFDVYSDFFNYKSGIYKRVKGRY